MTTSLRAASLVLLLGAALAPLVACGGDDDDGGATPGTADSDGGASPGSSGGGDLWYLDHDGYILGATDSSGKDLFKEGPLDNRGTALTIGGGSVWMWRKDGTISRYDHGTRKPLASIPALAKEGTAFAFASGALWIADYDTDKLCADGPLSLLRVDPATGTAAPGVTLQQEDTGSNCDKVRKLVTDGTRLWALIENRFTLASIDPATGNVLKRLVIAPEDKTGKYGAGGAALGDGVLWVHDTNAKTIIAVDPVTLTKKSVTPIPDDYQADDIVASKTQVIIKHSDTTLLRIDAADPTKQTVLPDLDVEGLASGRGETYALLTPGVVTSLVTLDPATGAPGKSLQLPQTGTFDQVVFVP